jgi:hypothetical protein
MSTRVDIKRGLLGRYVIGYDCPHCSGRLKSPIDEAGRTETCPECGLQFVVPGKTECDRIRAEQELDALRREAQKQEVERQRQIKLAEKTAKAKQVAEQRSRIETVLKHGQLPAPVDVNPNGTRRCPYCSEEILASAKKCKHCGEFLDSGLRLQSAPPRWNPGVAAVLSLVILGAGQMYKGQILNGVAWLFVVILGYIMLIIPGLILHICCILGAASGDPRK